MAHTHTPLSIVPKNHHTSASTSLITACVNRNPLVLLCSLFILVSFFPFVVSLSLLQTLSSRYARAPLPNLPQTVSRNIQTHIPSPHTHTHLTNTSLHHTLPAFITYPPLTPHITISLHSSKTTPTPPRTQTLTTLPTSPISALRAESSSPQQSNTASSRNRYLTEGDRVPLCKFKIPLLKRDGQEHVMQDFTTEDLFGGRRVVVFALPGAFTPTCSSKHLPQYERLFRELLEASEKAGGEKRGSVSDVYCLSVNDPFVMKSWAEDLGVKDVCLLPDGNGEFTRKMGMLVNKDNFNLGQRSWRYSMVLDDGVIERMFVEEGLGDNVEGDPFEVSGVEGMMRFLQGTTATAVGGGDNDSGGAAVGRQ
eukprot:GHVQ01027455.1.p1 GENE.GHVQ01027455.1~~GHVQ01027455.1.p1  ORF type:complete len:366 (+),score=72.84 GHVQ01027455.1:219-1316(+)